MEKLVELAGNIKDEELRKKVVDFLKDPQLSHQDFSKYPRTKIEDARTPFSVGGGGSIRDVLNHTVAVVDLCMKTADNIETNYGIPVNRDFLLAGALLHDVMKIYEWKNEKDGPEHTGIMLDHSMLGVAELYHRGFPEQVIHIVASHFGESGPTPPRSFEALILHHVDTLLSLTEFHLFNQVQKSIPLDVLEQEILKKLGEKNEPE